MDTGERIAELRMQAGLTQEQLAGKLFVSRELISKWEHGVRSPDYAEAGELARVLGVELSEIIDEEELIKEELAECIPENGGGGGQDIASLLNLFLPKLGHKARGMFVRRYHFHETPREISGMFGTSEAYVRTVLARTRRKLKQFFKEHAEK
ncbi:MAG: helix-turn-helix domain-containing protein [Clostridia bacterium]|nr:helix-turn-helix domain-containing protein [Clostridia bacterium]